MNLTSNLVELRGVAHKTTKSGKPFYSVNVELEDGTSYSFYCSNGNAFAEGLKKGDKVILTFEYKRYFTEERIVVVRVEKA